MKVLTAEQEVLFNDLATSLQKETALNFVRGGCKNQVEAYRKACEYLEKKISNHPDTSASEILNNPKVKAFVDSVRIQAAEEAQVDAAWVLKQAKKLHERCMQEITPMTHRDGTFVEDAEGNVIYRFDSVGAKASLDLIGKHVDVQAFKERVEHKHTIEDLTDDALNREIAKLTGNEE